jgi:acyl CoA:acetate/3-ketoacid CoA transferase beta subunit
VDVGFLGGAEVDQFGNLNATAIGQYEHPKIRLPGSGGANDIASMADRVVILMKHEKRRFPSKVGYITSPGFLEGGNSRKEAGLKGGGPAVLISNLAVMDFEPVSHRMRVRSIHPGISREQVQDATGFDLLWAEDLTTTPEPTQFQLDIIRHLDPNGIFLKGE